LSLVRFIRILGPENIVAVLSSLRTLLRLTGIKKQSEGDSSNKDTKIVVEVERGVGVEVSCNI
jgi:hypothetical protein